MTIKELLSNLNGSLTLGKIKETDEVLIFVTEENVREVIEDGRQTLDLGEVMAQENAVTFYTV